MGTRAKPIIVELGAFYLAHALASDEFAAEILRVSGLVPKYMVLVNVPVNHGFRMDLPKPAPASENNLWHHYEVTSTKDDGTPYVDSALFEHRLSVRFGVHAYLVGTERHANVLADAMANHTTAKILPIDRRLA